MGRAESSFCSLQKRSYELRALLDPYEWRRFLQKGHPLQSAALGYYDPGKVCMRLIQDRLSELGRFTSAVAHDISECRSALLDDAGLATFGSNVLTKFPFEVDRRKQTTKQARLRYMESVSNNIRHLRRRKAFYDWKAMMEHNRDRGLVQAQSAYIDKTKEDAARASKVVKEFDAVTAERDALRDEVQKMDDTVTSLAARLEEEIAAHEQTKDDLVSERAKHQTALWKLQIEEGRWARRETALHSFMERQPGVHKTLNRWRAEALTRCGFQAMILESRRFYVIQYRTLARVHEGATIAAGIEAREKKALEDKFADLAVKEQRLRQTLDNVRAEKNMLAERYRFLRAELDSERDVRMRKDVLLRDAHDTICRVKTLLYEEEIAHVKTRDAFWQTLDKEKRTHEHVSAMHQETITTLASEKSALEHMCATLQAELTRCEHHCEEQENTIATMLSHEQKLRVKYDAMEELNAELALKAQGLGPAVPAGFLCRRCQQDVQRDIRVNNARGLTMSSKVYDLLDIIQANRSAAR